MLLVILPYLSVREYTLSFIYCVRFSRRVYNVLGRSTLCLKLCVGCSDFSHDIHAAPINILDLPNIALSVYLVEEMSCCFLMILINPHLMSYLLRLSRLKVHFLHMLSGKFW